jgi:hypothetical protein
MQLTQMQDIGGVRALLPSLHHVYALKPPPTQDVDDHPGPRLHRRTEALRLPGAAPDRASRRLPD